jgi:hypothetical protein
MFRIGRTIFIFRTAVFTLLAILLTAVICVAPAQAATATGPARGGPSLPGDECDITSTCPSNNPQSLAIIPTLTLPLTAPGYRYDAVRSDLGSAVTPIDAWGFCRYVDNISPGGGTSIFVPFKSTLEWGSDLSQPSLGFLNAAAGSLRNYIKLASCARPATIQVPADFPIYPGFVNGTVVNNPYYRTQMAFACNRVSPSSSSFGSAARRGWPCSLRWHRAVSPASE